MSALPEATRGADQLVGPTNTGVHVGTATSTTTAAANLDLGVTKGGAFFSFQARGGNVYVRFKSTTSTAGTTSGDNSNGLKIIDGHEPVHFWISPGYTVVDHICDASSKYLFWWQSSPNYDART